MSKNKGFTLIELLVVIAIIGILASIVLASLTTARTKGQAAAVQAQLANMRAQAELYYSTASPNSYGAAHALSQAAASACSTAAADLFGTDTNSLSKLVPTNVATACVTTASPSAWAFAAIDPSVSAQTQAFCVDSTGVSKVKTGLGTANAPGLAITTAACN